MKRYKRYVGRWQTLAGFCTSDDMKECINLTQEQADLNSSGAWYYVLDTNNNSVVAGNRQN